VCNDLSGFLTISLFCIFFSHNTFYLVALMLSFSAMVLLVMLFCMPEAPRYLIKSGQID